MKRSLSTSHQSLRATCSCRGFTLIEMLLVLAVLLILAGVAYFSMDNAFRRRDLDETVEEVRKELARTRLYACDTALMYQFLYEPDGRRYVVIPYEIDTDPAAGEGSAERYPTVSRSLPEGFLFKIPRSPDGTEEKPNYVTIPEQFAQMLPDGSDFAGKKYLSILFHPEGEAEPLSLIVTDEDKNRSVTLTVRELTGAVSVGKMQEAQ